MWLSRGKKSLVARGHIMEAPQKQTNWMGHSVKHTAQGTPPTGNDKQTGTTWQLSLSIAKIADIHDAADKYDYMCFYIYIHAKNNTDLEVNTSAVFIVH